MCAKNEANTNRKKVAELAAFGKLVMPDKTCPELTLLRKVFKKAFMLTWHIKGNIKDDDFYKKFERSIKGNSLMGVYGNTPMGFLCATRSPQWPEPKHPGAGGNDNCKPCKRNRSRMCANHGAGRLCGFFQDPDWVNTNTAQKVWVYDEEEKMAKWSKKNKIMIKQLAIKMNYEKVNVCLTVTSHFLNGIGTSIENIRKISSGGMTKTRNPGVYQLCSSKKSARVMGILNTEGNMRYSKCSALDGTKPKIVGKNNPKCDKDSPCGTTHAFCKCECPDDITSDPTVLEYAVRKTAPTIGAY